MSLRRRLFGYAACECDGVHSDCKQCARARRLQNRVGAYLFLTVVGAVALLVSVLTAELPG